MTLGTVTVDPEQRARCHPSESPRSEGSARRLQRVSGVLSPGPSKASGDPGGWSAIEGRNFNSLLVRLGAPSGFLQPGVPSQSMPRGWPALPGRVNSFLIPTSSVRIAEGAPPRLRP